MSEVWTWRFLIFVAIYFLLRIVCHRSTTYKDCLWVALGATVLITLVNAWVMSEQISFKKKEYVIVAKKPPMWFSVTVRDVETGMIHENLTVSKFCTNHENIMVGSKHQLEEKIYRSSSGKEVISVNAYGIFPLCLKDY